MFLVYVPVISVSLYLVARSCLPSPARRIISRATSTAIITTAFTVTRACRYLTELRSMYVWEKRLCLPRPLVCLLDALLRIDVDQANLDTSSGHASIQVLTATLAVDGSHDYDVTKVLKDMWAYGDGTRVEIPVDAVLKCVGLQNVHADTTVVTRVRYRGHSNMKKRYSSETFSARYASKPSQVFRFPPYSSSEVVRRGLGIARIIRANFVEQNGIMLYGHEARESAGLRCNYYADVEDDECLEKNVVTFFDAFARFQEQKRIVVTTSKPGCNFIVN